MNLPHLIYCMSLLDWIQIIFIVLFGRDTQGGRERECEGRWILFNDTKTLFPKFVLCATWILLNLPQILDGNAQKYCICVALREMSCLVYSTNEYLKKLITFVVSNEVFENKWKMRKRKKCRKGDRYEKKVL